MKNGKTDQSFITDIADLIVNGPNASSTAVKAIEDSNRKGTAEELRRYGEDSVASAVEAAPDDIISAIGRRGIEISFSGESIPYAICLAAVELIEGKSRPLKHKRRKPAA